MADRAKKYSSLKYSAAIFETFYLLLLLFSFLASGYSKSLANIIISKTGNSFLLLPVYLLAISIGYYVLTLPLSFYHSYILEHKFSLSNQKIKDWIIDQVKAGILTYIIGIILVFAFYFILDKSPHAWWFIVSLFWIFFSLILARLTPTIIIPLFFKYKKLSNEGLRQRIISLAKKMGVRILDVFEIDFSKKTLKANAAFVGVGKTKRVLLADTLKDKYTDDEVEVILAHEFAHYRLKHLVKLIFVNACATLFIFYIIFVTSGNALQFFGFASLSDIAAMPLIFIYFIIFGIVSQPFEAYISRRFEREADREALEVTEAKTAFISMMNKLGEQNLADRTPHPLIKLYFFDHPPIDERIKMAESFKDKEG